MLEGSTRLHLLDIQNNTFKSLHPEVSSHTQFNSTYSLDLHPTEERGANAHALGTFKNTAKRLKQKVRETDPNPSYSVKNIATIHIIASFMSQ